MSENAVTPGPMTGVRVVELGAWVAGPAAGAVLADWGAQVIKVEPLGSDPFRGMVTLGPEGVNPAFEFENRGKRSLSLDVATPKGRQIFADLLWSADVFITNLRPATLESLGLDPASLHEAHPALIVATLNGFGERGPDRDRPSYDMGGFWARSGLAASHTLEGGEPPILRGAVGDHMAAMSLVAGISAALFERTRTGAGRHVSTSLLRNGVYAGGQDANIYARTGGLLPMGGGRLQATNPLYNTYKTADGRWLWLLGLQPDRHWPAIAKVVGHPEWLDDERFGSFTARRTNSAALIALLDDVFVQQTLAEWSDVLEAHKVWWEPVATLPEAVDGEQLRASGGLVQVPVSSSEGVSRTIASPVDFDGVSATDLIRTPEFSEHTEEVLLELGFEWADIATLRDERIIP
jgi:crotonobetainyl-CoA:carnitine CoA-transferase CaiB-like acyl-CoA transferase